MNLRLERLDLALFADFATLLAGSEFGGCYCACWTSMDSDWNRRCADSLQPNLELSKRDVLNGRKAGFLVFDDDAVIGWTGSGPRPEFPLLQSKLASRLTESLDSTWAIGCLALKREYRGLGLSRQIIKLVIDEARKSRAEILEAYPVRPFDELRSYRGSYQTYLELGFLEIDSEPDEFSSVLLMQMQL